MDFSLGKHCDPWHGSRSESRRVAPELSAFAHGPSTRCHPGHVRGTGGANPFVFLRKMVLVRGADSACPPVQTTFTVLMSGQPPSAVRRAEPAPCFSHHHH